MMVKPEKKELLGKALVLEIKKFSISFVLLLFTAYMIGNAQVILAFLGADVSGIPESGSLIPSDVFRDSNVFWEFFKMYPATVMYALFFIAMLFFLGVRLVLSQASIFIILFGLLTHTFFV